jgi:hypothetical protein
MSPMVAATNISMLPLADQGGAKREKVPRPRAYKLIPSRNLGSGFEDVAVVVCHQEIAVGHLHGSRIITDENVYSEVILPEVSDLEPVQVMRSPQGVDYLFADENLPPMARVSLLILGRLTLFLRWYHFLLPFEKPGRDGISRSSSASS